MTMSKIPRRTFLKGLGLMVLASGCSSEIFSLTREPTATPLPTPTPTPLPSAEAVVQAYLTAWRAGDYDIMYQLLAPASQVALSREQFRGYYLQAQTAATVAQIETQIGSLLHDYDQAAATFNSVWETLRFGVIEANNQMHLQFDGGRWGVVWQPTLVLPQLGAGVTLAFLTEAPTRGNIYDVNFHALASQGQLVTIGVIPQFLEEEETIIGTLSRITGVKPDKISKNIAVARPDWFVPIADVDFETSLAYDNLLNNMAGVDRRARTVRIYNDGDTAAHMIGYMGKIPADKKEQYRVEGYQGDELVGLSGVEAWAEQELAGQQGGRLVTLAPPPARSVLSEIATATSRAGSSVSLTIDTLFQANVERLLGEQRGAILVMEPFTGAIYALASYPRFKPAVFTTGFDVNAWTELYTNKDRPLINRAAQGLYPPGSIFKIVSISAALEALELEPETTFVCNGKWHGLGKDFEKKCWLETGHGKINLIDGLTQSCNVVFYEIGLALHKSDQQLLPDWARNYGLGQPTEIVGIEESSGVVPDNAWKQANLNQPLFDGDAVNTAIGQGFMLATPLQIVRMLAAIANGGKLVRPRIVDRIVRVDGTEQIFEPKISGTLPISTENLALIHGSLKEITSGARGTARQAFVGFPYPVAGKTGTAESGQKKPHSWFAGYAPADKPRVAIAVILEEAGEGSKVAAPLFRRVAELFFEWEASQT
jgi:penicillin-binding protein 2